MTTGNWFGSIFWYVMTIFVNALLSQLYMLRAMFAVCYKKAMHEMCGDKLQPQAN